MHNGTDAITSMLTHDKRKLLCKVWLEYKGEAVLGEGGAEILRAIKEEKSMSKAATKVGMSYRYVWNYLAKIENILHEPVVRTFRGGREGGGGTHLTELGKTLLREYERVADYVGEILDDETQWEAVGLKISARNRLRGTVEEVEKGLVTAKVRVKINRPLVVTAIISKEAVEDLGIRAGDEVEAVIKATEVMIAKEKTT